MEGVVTLPFFFKAKLIKKYLMLEIIYKKMVCLILKINHITISLNNLYSIILMDCLSLSLQLRFENPIKQKKSKITCSFFKFVEFIRDLDRIQTCNLLSRNQMRYSVAPRGLFEGANIGIFD